MKLMLGTTELADIPDDVAAQLIRLFGEPGRLKTMPEIGGIQRPINSFAQLQGSYLGHVTEAQNYDVTFTVTATVNRLGPLVDSRDYDRIMGR
jgi:hypothetical protein